MIMLTEIRADQNEKVRILVHKHDILQVFEKNTKQGTLTFAIIRNPNGSSYCIEIQESILYLKQFVIF